MLNFKIFRVLQIKIVSKQKWGSKPLHAFPRSHIVSFISLLSLSEKSNMQGCIHAYIPALMPSWQTSQAISLSVTEPSLPHVITRWIRKRFALWYETQQLEAKSCKVLNLWYEWSVMVGKIYPSLQKNSIGMSCSVMVAQDDELCWACSTNQGQQVARWA